MGCDGVATEVRSGATVRDRGELANTKSYFPIPYQGNLVSVVWTQSDYVKRKVPSAQEFRPVSKCSLHAHQCGAYVSPLFGANILVLHTTLRSRTNKNSNPAWVLRNVHVSNKKFSAPWYVYTNHANGKNRILVRIIIQNQTTYVEIRSSDPSYTLGWID